MDGKVALWDLQLGRDNAADTTSGAALQLAGSHNGIGSGSGSISASSVNHASGSSINTGRQPRQICLLSKHKYGVLSVAYSKEQVRMSMVAAVYICIWL